jgi:hypothetical protein
MEVKEEKTGKNKGLIVNYKTGIIRKIASQEVGGGSEWGLVKTSNFV